MYNEPEWDADAEQAMLGEIHEVLSGRQTKEDMEDKWCKFPNMQIKTSQPGS